MRAFMIFIITCILFSQELKAEELEELVAIDFVTRLNQACRDAWNVGGSVARWDDQIEVPCTTGDNSCTYYCIINNIPYDQPNYISISDICDQTCKEKKWTWTEDKKNKLERDNSLHRQSSRQI